MTTLNATLLLRLELAVLVSIAFLFLAIPNTTIRILGLPTAGASFWPRLVGAAFLGMAVAAVATDQAWTKSGLGIGGFVAINLTFSFVLMSLLVVGPSIPTRRGKVILWILATFIATLGFVQIAYAA